MVIERSPTVERGKILIVDDENVVRRLARASLQGRVPHEIFEASNLQEALEKVGEHAFHLVISDVNFEDRTGGGPELLNHLRRDPRHARVPVILMSGANMEERDEAAQTHENVHTLDKPFSPSKLVGKVKELLRL